MCEISVKFLENLGFDIIILSIKIKEINIEKHQYGFAIMNTRTGGCTRKSFWGRGSSEEECRRDAFTMANTYAEQKTDETYRKACARDRSGYRPSRSSYEFQVVGCSLWK